MKQPIQPAHPLVFQDVTFSVIDRAGELWLRYPQIADAFGYSSARRVNDLYNSNKEEFTSEMTTVIDLDTAGGRQPVRIFSLRGAHLLGMFAQFERDLTRERTKAGMEALRATGVKFGRKPVIVGAKRDAIFADLSRRNAGGTGWRYTVQEVADRHEISVGAINKHWKGWRTEWAKKQAREAAKAARQSKR